MDMVISDSSIKATATTTTTTIKTLPT